MIRIELEVDGADAEQIEKYKQIFRVLIEKGALDGVRGGRAILHFDADCMFQGCELQYWPWRRRKT
jgi:hypothetical protein